MSLFDLLPAEKKERLMQAFGRDAQKAIAALKEARSKDDIQSLTSSFHAMKSALGNIGQTEKSEIAFKLEQVGRDGNLEFITAHVDGFIKALQELIPAEASESSDNASEDNAFVIEQLTIAQSACDNGDDKPAYSVFDLLLEKPLKNETRNFVKKMRDLLYSDSDFDGVSAEISVFLGGY
jgi:HPt (histidine-containing phosphotransfer) domain-containing protein